MVGIINLKWRDAVRVAGHAFTKAEQEAGWPARMSAPQLAAMQRPRYFPPVMRMMEPAPHDPAAAAQIGRNAANRALLKALTADFDAGHGPDTAPMFAAWLAANGEQPSKHIAAWFEAAGVLPTIRSASPRNPKRRDLLTPAIELAQKACNDPYDVPAVFAELRRLASEKVRPLIGVAPEGIQWTDGNDDAKFLSLNSLRERLRRQKLNQ